MDCLSASQTHVPIALEIAKSFHKTPSLVSYRVRCGKPSCHCNEGERHGPYWFLRWRVGERQRRRYVRAEDVAAVHRVIEERRARDRMERIARQTAYLNLREVKRWLIEIERELFS